jgi:hypothetical protein
MNGTAGVFSLISIGGIMTPSQFWRIRKIALDTYSSYRVILDVTERIKRPDAHQIHAIKVSLDQIRQMVADIDAIMEEASNDQ